MNYICVSLTLVLFQLDHIILEERKSMNVTEIVESINKNKHLPWQASTYKETQIDVNLFARTKLGLRTGKENYTDKRIKPRILIKKATLKPDTDTDYTGLPIEFTWAKTKRTTCPTSKIRDQSNCGSCWAVSTAAVLGDRFCIQSKGKKNIPLSHEFVIACDQTNYACNGGYMHLVNEFMVKNGTITGGEYDSDEGCQQYTVRPCGFPSTTKMPCDYDYSENPKCKLRKCNNDWYPHRYEPDSNVFKAEKWKFIESNDTLSREDCIRDEIYRNGPVTASFYVLEDFMVYKKGVYVPSHTAWTVGGHAVRVLGWGVENRLKYWHVANSWSAEWGENGFFKIIRGVDAVGFEREMTAFTIPSQN